MAQSETSKGKTKEVIITKDNIPSVIGPILKAANALIVKDTAGLEAAAQGKAIIKARLTAIHGIFDEDIKKADQLHKSMVANRNGFTGQLEEANRIIDRKVSAHRLEQDRIAEENAREERRKAEQERQAAIDAANEKIAKALTNAGTLEQKIQAALTIARDPSLSVTEREMAQRQLNVFNAQLEGLQDTAREQQEQVEEVAAAPVYIAPVVQEKVKGLTSRKVYKVTGIDPMVLIKLIAEGKAPITILKDWKQAFDITTIQRMRGLGVSFLGVAYQEEYSNSSR
jgi:hypothetical protein